MISHIPRLPNRWLGSLGLFCFLLQALPGNTQNTAPAEKGRSIYNFRCYFCHGYSGNAQTLAATYLSPKPADFTRLSAANASIQSIALTVKYGRPGTGMRPFQGILNDQEIEEVSRFVRSEFVERKAVNTRYHTPENGWPNHERHKAAFPFVTGEIAVSRSWELLSPQEVMGKRVYLASCITCHDRGVAPEDVNESATLEFERIKAHPSGKP